MIWNILLETFIDVLKALPILFIVYLLIEFFSHKKRERSLAKVLNKYGPLMSGVVGLIPQCGFNAALADLYSKRKITIGTLFAVFIATSDEAVAIFLAHPEFYGQLFLLILIKFIAAIFFGYLLDFIINKNKTRREIIKSKSLSETNSLKNDLDVNLKCSLNNSKVNLDVNSKTLKSNESISSVAETDFDFNKNKHACKTCGKSNSIFYNALIHAVKIALLLFVVALILNLIIEWVGEENIKQLLSGAEVFAILIAALIGLIPACGISVIFASLFISGIISFATVIAALCAGTGMGLAVLLAKNKNVKENLFIIVLLYLVSILIGMLVFLANLLFF